MKPEGFYCRTIPFLFAQTDAIYHKEIHEYKCFSSKEHFEKEIRITSKYIMLQVQAQMLAYQKTKCFLFLFLIENEKIIKFHMKVIYKNYDFKKINFPKMVNYFITNVFLTKILCFGPDEISLLPEEKIKELEEILKTDELTHSKSQK